MPQELRACLYFGVVDVKCQILFCSRQVRHIFFTLTLILVGSAFVHQDTVQ